MKKFNFHYNYSDDADLSQPLFDVSKTGRVRPWKLKKEYNMYLADIYENINPSKSVRLRDCASFLSFKRNLEGDLKLFSMNSCRVRLCPMCSWRRSLKIFSHVSRIMDYIKSNDNLVFLFLTLTIQNCNGDELHDQIDLMMSSWQRFMQRKKISSNVLGWYRGLEITFNNKDFSFHPHFHCVFVLDKSYFKKNYISQDLFSVLWQESLRVDYKPIVYVKKIRGSIEKAVAEIAKYTVKDYEYILPDDLILSEYLVSVLDKVLENRRLVAYGGLLKEIHRKLNLDDELDGDLVNIDNDHLDSCSLEEIVFVWNVGFQNYYRKI